MSAVLTAQVTQVRASFTPFVCEGLARGYTRPQLRGQLAALLVINAGLPRVQAHAVVRFVV